jgi:hypothetical protein
MNKYEVDATFEVIARDQEHAFRKVNAIGEVLKIGGKMRIYHIDEPRLVDDPETSE